FSNALRTIFAAAEGIDETTMALQYLEALKALGAGSSTKWILPMELSELTRPMTDAMKLARAGGDAPAAGGGASGASAAAGGSTAG
ncbi:MAG TPA: hypothetical protein VFX74_05825, partial [Candidatus Limnocylindria bacterium]|nr:hypothetical protein [Candidatus Limnocylindria bacterium]